ncbi:MAG TPA: hypothetical protein PKA66_11525 [Gemmatimonadales bacterium]|nr:hypothetical protein [Gemmatimonadales bacterium]
MIRRILTIVTAAGLAALLPPVTPLAAQVPGLPVFNSGVPRGIYVAGDVGFPEGGGNTYAATGAIGLGMLGFTGTFGSYDPGSSGSSNAVYGGTANLRLIGGPLVPFFVNLQAGVGYGDLDGFKTTHVPVGVGIGLTIPLPIFGLKPWFAPRWDYTSVSGLASTDNSRFGYSAGLDISFIFGLGLRTAYDWIDTGTGSATTWSLGAKWALGL